MLVLGFGVSEPIRYRRGYKYQLVDDWRVKTPISGITADTRFLSLSPTGLLIIRAGYAWDGASGPAFDTTNFMRGSLVHDALYQLMREGHLNATDHRGPSDNFLAEMIRGDGMNWLRAWWVLRAVRAGGLRSATEAREVLEVP